VFISLQNPIEPSINDFESFNDALESRINAYKPIYQHADISTHDVNPVSRTHSYQPKNPLYDSEYIAVPDVPNLFPEDSYDYKYLGLPSNKYLTRPSTTKSDNPINLVAITKTSVVGYEIPSYKSPYSPSMWNLDSKIPNTFFGDSQSVETDPDTFKLSSPTVRIVKLLPETLKQVPTTTSKYYPYNFLFSKLLSNNPDEVKNAVKNKSIYEITQETPTADESDSLLSEDFQTEDLSDWSDWSTSHHGVNSTTTKKTPAEDELNSWMLDSVTTENELNSITTEDESNSITTEDEFNSITTEKESNYITTEDESNSITTEQESNYITSEDESNSITIKESQTKGDESKSTNSQETITAFNQNYGFGPFGETPYFNFNENIDDWSQTRFL